MPILATSKAMRISSLAATSIAASLFSAAVLAQAVPCPSAEKIPTGIHQDPAEVFDDQHYMTTAGMSLQGNLASVKYAPVMVPYNQQLNPMDPDGNVADFQTVYIIDNPDTTLPLLVDVDFFEANGTPAGGLGVMVPPNGHIQRRVGLGDLNGPRGMIRVKVNPASLVQEFVGATTYWATQVISPFAPPGSGTTRLGLGMSSMQPLQEYQSEVSEIVRFGPIPVRLLSGIDSLNGLFAFQNVCNPTSQDNNITVTIRGGLSGTISNSYTIKPNGTRTLFDAWNYAASVYPTLTQDHDVVVEIKSTSGLPVLGENIFLDLFEGRASGGSGGGTGPLPGQGQEGVQLGQFLGRARMSSMMLGYTPKSRLINPELTDRTYAETTPIQSTMGICNVNPGDAGPIAIEYFDNLGVSLGMDTIASLPQFASVVIGPGLNLSPNFPSSAAGVFKGSVRIRACGGTIIGWANRASERALGSPHADAPKMWGELLHRAGGAEHAVGWLAGGVRNKIAPLVLNRVNETLPSYIAFANHRSSNTNAYAMQFFDTAGMPTATTPSVYAGLPWRTTCFSYLENLITVDPSIGSPTNLYHHHALVSVRTQSIEGIQTIGGRIELSLNFIGEYPYYPGPGDVLR
jgi:hypothetical protein